MSPFQALTTAIAAQVGTGNIAGAATALYSGGPGAIFWMWLSAFFGMSTIYSEAVLAQKYKTTDDKGHVTGGPIYYIRARFTGKFGKFLAGFFSVAIIFALGFTGNMVQANSISVAFNTAFGAPMIVVGIICAIIAAFIFLGGVGRIASVTEKVVPIMALFYMAGCIVILCINHAAIIPAFKSIFVAAFDPQAILGGAAGITVRQAMRYGVARGLFSNEAGMGSTPHAHALAKVKRPQDQGRNCYRFRIYRHLYRTDADRYGHPDLGHAQSGCTGRSAGHRAGTGGLQGFAWLGRHGFCCHLHAVLRVLYHHRLVFLR